MALNRDLYIQLDKKDLANGLAAFFHAKSVEDRGAYNARTRSINSQQNGQLAIDFGEDTPYTAIIYRNSSGDKITRSIVNGKVDIDSDINFNDVQLYASDVADLYRSGDNPNSIYNFGYDTSKTYSTSTKSTIVVAEDNDLFSTIDYPHYQISNETHGRNPIRGSSYVWDVPENSSLNDNNLDSHKDEMNNKMAYFLKGSNDSTKKNKPTGKFYNWGMATESLYNSFNTPKWAYKFTDEGIIQASPTARTWLIKGSYNTSNKKLTLEKYKPVLTGGRNFDAKTHWNNYSNGWQNNSFATPPASANAGSYLGSGQNVAWELQSTSEYQIDNGVVVIYEVTPAAATSWWNINTYTSRWNIGNDTWNNQGDFVYSTSDGVTRTSYSKNKTISCGNTNAYTISLNKYPYFLWKAGDLVESSEKIPIQFQFRSQSNLYLMYGVLAQWSRVPELKKSTYNLFVSETNKEITSSSWTAINQADSDFVIKNNLDYQMSRPIVPGYNVTGGITSVTAKIQGPDRVAAGGDDGLFIRNSVNYLDFRQSSFSYQIPAIYKILGLEDNFYFEPDSNNLQFDILQSGDWFLYEFWCQLTYSGYNLHNVPGIGDLSLDNLMNNPWTGWIAQQNSTTTWYQKNILPTIFHDSLLDYQVIDADIKSDDQDYRKNWRNYAIFTDIYIKTNTGNKMYTTKVNSSNYQITDATKIPERYYSQDETFGLRYTGGIPRAIMWSAEASMMNDSIFGTVSRDYNSCYWPISKAHFNTYWAWFADHKQYVLTFPRIWRNVCNIKLEKMLYTNTTVNVHNSTWYVMPEKCTPKQWELFLDMETAPGAIAIQYFTK